MAVNDRLDPRALREGALVAAVVAVPAGVVGRVLSDRPDQPDWLWVLVVVVLAGLVAGAAVAASRQDRGFPLTHGVVTAVGVFVAVQTVGILIRLVAGRLDQLEPGDLQPPALADGGDGRGAARERRCSPNGRRRR